MSNRFLLAIIFPSATRSRVLHYALHSSGTAALFFAALDKGPAYGKYSRIWKPFNTVLFSIILSYGSLLVPSRLNKTQKKEADMISETTHSDQYKRLGGSLYLAFELSQKQWKLGFTIGIAQRPRIRNIMARDLHAFQYEIKAARQRFGLPGDAPVFSCYEAGRDGFWIHRYLETYGIQNRVVDPASIEVSRRARRRKTDKLDVTKLLAMLIRYHSGERKVWRVVLVPSRQAEDARQLHRELLSLKTERTRHINLIKGLLISQGVSVPVKANFPDRL